MRRRAAKVSALTVMIAMMIPIQSFAGAWKTDNGRWWYDNGDGTWAQDGWQWIDSNGDGMAECYYFGPDGYLLASTDTPDGYMVDGSGAWIVNGQVQQIATGRDDKAGTEWVGAYAALLNSHKQVREYGRDCFALIYIDGDSIPELMIHNTRPIHHDGPELYTYHNGQVVSLEGYFGNGDGFDYLEKQNYIYGFDSGTGTVTHTFYRILDGQAVKVNEYESYEPGDIYEPIRYSKNGVSISKATYDRDLNADIGDPTAYKSSPGGLTALEITAANIRRMQEDVGFAIR